MEKILEFYYNQVGSTGICKGLRADWNDCLNLGGGESAMVAFLQRSEERREGKECVSTCRTRGGADE